MCCSSNLFSKQGRAIEPRRCLGTRTHARRTRKCEERRTALDGAICSSAFAQPARRGRLDSRTDGRLTSSRPVFRARKPFTLTTQSVPRTVRGDEFCSPPKVSLVSIFQLLASLPVFLSERIFTTIIQGVASSDAASGSKCSSEAEVVLDCTQKSLRGRSGRFERARQMADAIRRQSEAAAAQLAAMELQSRLASEVPPTVQTARDDASAPPIAERLPAPGVPDSMNLGSLAHYEVRLPVFDCLHPHSRICSGPSRFMCTSRRVWRRLGGLTGPQPATTVSCFHLRVHRRRSARLSAKAVTPSCIEASARRVAGNGRSHHPPGSRACCQHWSCTPEASSGSFPTLAARLLPSPCAVCAAMHGVAPPPPEWQPPSPLAPASGPPPRHQLLLSLLPLRLTAPSSP